MNIIRFACPKCAQRLACEPDSLGTQIQCPACKQGMLVPTVEILKCYQLLELELRAPLNEIRQAHLERTKLWDPERFANDPQAAKQAAEKNKELNGALATIGAYFAGTYTAAPASVRAREEVRTEPESKPRPVAENEKRAAPKSAQPATHPALAAGRSGQTGSWLKWVLIALGVTVTIALLVGLVIEMVQRGGPTLSNESTGTQWLQAKERAKRAYCHSVLLEMEKNGTFRKTGLRVNDDFFYDGLEATFKKRNPEDLSSKLVDLSTKLVNTPQ